MISIHAPRAGRDSNHFENLEHTVGSFQSTRPVRGATADYLLELSPEKFQSTRPVRGATRRPCGRGRRSRYFNPRAPCGARRRQTCRPWAVS